MTITMDALTALSDGDKVVTTGAAGQRVWTADGNGNLIDVAGAPVPLDYFASHVAANTIVPYRDGMEDNPMPRPGTLVQRGGSFFFVLGEAPERPGYIQLGIMDGSYMTRLYEYEWEVESANIIIIRQPDVNTTGMAPSADGTWGPFEGYINQRGKTVYNALARRLGEGAAPGDVKMRLREFADKFRDDDFWQFLQAYNLVPTVRRTVTVNLSGRARVDTGAFGAGFEAGGTAEWKRVVETTLTVLPESGCVCDHINQQDFAEEHKPAAATTTRVDSTSCGEGCNNTN